MQKRILSAALVLFFMMSLLIGCSNSGESSEGKESASTADSESVTDSNSEDSAESPAETSGEAVELTFGYTSSDTAEKFWREMTDAFIAENPNITFELEGYGDGGDYINKIKVLAATDSLPDTFFHWLGTAMEPVLEAGGALNLSPYLEEDADWKGNYVKNALDAAQAKDGNIYIVPHKRVVLCYWTNTQLFEENGIAFPETYDDYLAAVPALKEAGIIPWVIGARDDWSLSWSADDFWVRYDTVSTDYYFSIRDGEAKFAENEDYAKGVNHLLELREAGAFNDNASSKTKEEAMALFCNMDAAVFSSGSFDIGYINDNHVDPTQVKPVAWFAFTDSDTPQNMISDNYESGCVIASKLEGAKLEAALAWTKWTSSQEADKILLSYGNITCYTHEISSEYSSPLLEETLALSNNCERYLHSYYMMNAAFQPGFYRATADLFTGALTAEEYLTALDNVYVEAYGG